MQVIAALTSAALLARIQEDYTPHPHHEKRQWLPRYIIAPGFAIGFVNVHYPVITGFLILHLARHGNSGPVAFFGLRGGDPAVAILPRRIAGPRPPGHYLLSRAELHGGGPLGPGLWSAADAGHRGHGRCSAFGFSFPWASIASTVLRATPPNQRGSSVGLLSAFYDLFVGTSSFAAGAVAGHFGYPAAFAMAAAAVVVAAIVGRLVFTQAEAQLDPEEESAALV